MNKLLRLFTKKLRAHNRTLLLLDIIYKLLIVIFLIPFINHALKYVMSLWGQSYITSENLKSFLTFPPSILLLIIFIIIMLLIILCMVTTMIHYCNTEESHIKPHILRVMAFGFLKTLRLIFSGNIALILYTFFFYLFANISILIGVTLQTHFDFQGGKNDEMFLKGLILICLAFICFIAFRGIFVIHFSINERRSFSESLVKSKLLIKGRNLKTAGILLVYNLVLTLGFFLIYYTLLIATALIVFLFVDKSMVITVFLSMYPKINIYTLVFFSMLGFIININLISSLYFSYQEEDFKVLSPEYDILEETPSLLPLKKHKHVVNGFLIFVIAAGLFNFYLTIRNDTLFLGAALSGIQISSHRGNSHVAPENTIPAIENAIIAYSDYAEIDVQQTKDGVLVLLHDRSLWRTAGLNKNIWNLTYEEIKDIDVGSWFGSEFIGTKIPTLEEVLEYSKGKIKLNIEIKIHGHEQNLEETLIALIEQYSFEHQCIISSWNYNTLIQIKQQNNEIRTGYILTAAYGNFYEKEYVDFFSIHSRYITKYVVDSAHSVGKEVHAWTVNSVNEIERMKSIGVDSIITDNPSLAREVLYRDDTSQTFIELLNRMMNNWSFYRLLQR